MGFGRYKEMTVHDLIYGLDKAYEIRRAYYNLDKVSFNEEVLDIVGIEKEFRIPKPGKDYAMLKKCDAHRVGNLSDIERLNNWRRNKKAGNIRRMNIDKNSVKSKDSMRHKNQGHKRN